MNSDQSFEHDIRASFEKGEWQPVKNQKKENMRYRELAAETLRKSRRVNIRITAMDLEGLQARAAEEGLPYQTLMASVLHKYISGRLVDGAGGKTSPPGRVVRKRAVV